MTRNERIINLLKEIMLKDFSRKIWQMEYLLQYAMAHPECLNNLHNGVYHAVGKKYGIDPGSVDKNISRLIPYIDGIKLSEITGREVDMETLTPAKLIDILVIYLKEEEYKITN